jgi:hypothetical protein
MLQMCSNTCVASRNIINNINKMEYFVLCGCCISQQMVTQDELLQFVNYHI